MAFCAVTAPLEKLEITSDPPAWWWRRITRSIWPEANVKNTAATRRPTEYKRSVLECPGGPVSIIVANSETHAKHTYYRLFSASCFFTHQLSGSFLQLMFSTATDPRSTQHQLNGSDHTKVVGSISAAAATLVLNPNDTPEAANWVPGLVFLTTVSPAGLRGGSWSWWWPTQVGSGRALWEHLGVQGYLGRRSQRTNFHLLEPRTL